MLSLKSVLAWQVGDETQSFTRISSRSESACERVPVELSTDTHFFMEMKDGKKKMASPLMSKHLYQVRTYPQIQAAPSALSRGIAHLGGADEGME